MSTATKLTPSTFEMISIKLIDESPTNPRKHFDEEALKELAESLRSLGQLQPVLVRPIKGGRYQLVFGHRRLRAAKLAKLDQVQANIREMDDLAVLKAQLVENVRRQDIDAFEESEGYRRLHNEHHLGVDEIARETGKSKATIYSRMKLGDLTPKARALVDKHQLGPERALLIARIPDPDRQLEATHLIANYSSWDPENSQPWPFRKASEYVRDHYMLKLAGAPFDTKDPDLVKEAGPCTTCPFRTKNHEDLFGDIGKADLCTKPTCFNEKKATAWKNERKDARESGLRVLTGDEGKEVFARYGHDSKSQVDPGAAFVHLGDECQLDPKRRTWKQILGKEAPAPSVVAKNPAGKVVELVPRAEVAKALKEKGVAFAAAAAKTTKSHTASSGESRDRYAEQQAKEEAERHILEAAQARAMKDLVAIAEKAPVLELLRLLVDLLVSDDYVGGQVLKARWPKERSPTKLIAAMSASQLAGLAIELAAEPVLENRYYEDDKDVFADVCKKAGVDLAAHLATVRVERAGPEEKPAPTCYVCNKPAVPTPKDGLTQDAIGRAHNKCLNGMSDQESAQRALKLRKLERERLEAAEEKPAKGKKSTPADTSGKDAKPVSGVCRVCGCTDDKPCVDPDGYSCSWGDTTSTICLPCKIKEDEANDTDRGPVIDVKPGETDDEAEARTKKKRATK